MLSFLGNYYRLPLFFNIDLIFSNIPVFLSIYLFGTVWGMIVAGLGGIYTIIYWGHPYEFIIILVEALVIGLTWRRYAKSLVLLEAIFRLCIGLPLIYIVGEFVTPWEASQTLLIALKGLINGVLNAALASLLIIYLPLATWSGRKVPPLCPSLRHILINLITTFILLPTLTLLILNGWQLINKVKAEIITTLNTVSSNATTNLHLQYEKHQIALNDLIGNIKHLFADKPFPVKDFHLKGHVKSLLALFPEFHQLTLTDTHGKPLFIQSRENQKTYLTTLEEKTFQQVLDTQMPETFVTIVNDQNSQQPLLAYAFPIFHQQQFVGVLLVHFKMYMRHAQGHNLQCNLIDGQKRVIETTRSDIKILQPYDRLLPQLQAQTQQPYLLLSKQRAFWQEARYIKHTKISEDFPISVVVEMPMRDYIQTWQQLYTHRLLVLAGIVLIGLIFAMLISNHLVNPLLKLIHITHDLPSRLERESIQQWPQSKIHEIDTLTHRFASMANSLQARFAEIYAAKSMLEQRVVERTQELQQEKTLLFNLIDAIPALIYYKDDQGRYLGCNQAFECFVNNDEQSMIGKTDAELFQTEFEILFSTDDKQALTSGIQQKYEKCIRSKSKQKMLLETLKTPFFDAQGKLLGVIGVSYDLSSRKRIEEALRQSQDMLRLVMDNIPQSIFWKDGSGIYLGCNKNFADTIGFSEPEEIIGKSDIELVNLLTQQSNTKLLDVLSHCHTQEINGKHKQIKSIQLNQNEEHWLEIHKMLLQNVENKRVGILCSFEDITEQKWAEEKLRQAAKVMEHSTNGIAITNSHAEIIAVNKAFTQITGYTEAEILSQPTKKLKSGEHTKDFYQKMWTSINTTGHWEGEIWNRRKSGDIFLEWLHITVIKDEQTDEVTHYIAIFSDITARKQTEQKLAYLAHYDDLTGLAKRSLFYEIVDRALRRAEKTKRFIAVLFLDLDRFKYVNDTWGHAIGDLLLKDVANRLTNCLRRGDSIARLGGDEFTAVLENLNSIEEVVRIVKRIIDAMQLPFHLDGNEAFVTASVGISLYPNDGNEVETLIRNADAAMYRAKESGKNNYEFFTQKMTGQASQRLSLEAKLRYALERNELVLHYQPQMHLASGHIVGVEALIRWQHPDMGLVYPQTFIPLAEETGLIVDIGEWVLRRACLQHQHWRDSGKPILRMAVNLSPRQFKNASLMARVLQVLEETHMDPSFLELELTESVLMQDTGASSEILHKFKEMGVQLAIDDFGTEYASLSYLKKFPITKLKIDQSFIRDIPNDKDDMAITRAIIALGRSLNLSVIAEGVENKSQLIFLKAAKCDEVQGYFIGQPVPEEELMADILLV